MTAEIPEHRIVYFSIPKVASTSLKELFYLANHGKPYERKVEERVHIHNEHYRTVSFYRHEAGRYDGHLRLAVVRDPIKRVLSCYSNRVLARGKLASGMIDAVAAERLGAPADPDIDTFIKKLDIYRALSGSIRNHTQPSAHYLGPDLGWFHHVFPIEDVDRMVALLSERTGLALTLPKKQTSEKKIAFEDLSARARDRLREFCAADYAYLKDFYRPA